jgi:hypothetical protein
MGKEKEIIVDEVVGVRESATIGTRVELKSTIRPFPEKGLNHIARRLIEKLLPYFISDTNPCPDVILCEADGSNAISLNNYVGGGSDALIVESTNANGDFQFEGLENHYDFSVRTFKI